MTMILVILSGAACGHRDCSLKTLGGGGDRPGQVKIDVTLDIVNGVCKVKYVDSPKKVYTDQTVYWRYKNKCKQKKNERIDPMTVPITGDCKKDTQVYEDGNANGNEADSKECAPFDVTNGPTKYKIEGDVELDPELDIEKPPGTDKITPPPQSR